MAEVNMQSIARGLNRMIDARQEELEVLQNVAQLLNAQSLKIRELMGPPPASPPSSAPPSNVSDFPTEK